MAMVIELKYNPRASNYSHWRDFMFMRSLPWTSIFLKNLNNYLIVQLEDSLI